MSGLSPTALLSVVLGYLAFLFLVASVGEAFAPRLGRGRAGTPRISTGWLAMASSGQTRHAPNSRKQATSSSAAFIGSEDYSSIARGPDGPSGPLPGR